MTIWSHLVSRPIVNLYIIWLFEQCYQLLCFMSKYSILYENYPIYKYGFMFWARESPCGNVRIFLTQILREINFGKLEALTFENWLILVFKKRKNSQISQFRASKRAKIAILDSLDSPTLISRKFKIWVTEKFCNFPTEEMMSQLPIFFIFR